MNENLTGVPFCGDAGEVLEAFLGREGIFRPQVFVTNIVRYWPGPGNPDPDEKDVLRDRAWLVKEVREVDPALLVGIGRIASQRLLGYSDSEFDLELMQGKILRANDRGVLGPIGKGMPVGTLVHPAAGLHDPGWAARTYQNIKDLAPAICWARDHPTSLPDEFIHKDHILPLVTPTILRPKSRIGAIGTVAVDTEGTPDFPFSVQVAFPASSVVWVIPAEYAHHLELLGPICFHNAKWDVRMLRVMGVKFTSDPAKWHDSMIAAYVRQDEPSQGLKQLAYRQLGYRMSTYEDLVRPYYNKEVLEALRTLAAIKFTRPDPVMVETPKGMQWKSPHALHTRAKSLLRSYEKDSGLDLESRWLKIPEDQRKVGEEYGVEVPRKSIHLVPLSKAAAYGALDAKATRDLHTVYKVPSHLPLGRTYDLDCMILPTLLEMEDNGMPFSVEKARELDRQFTVRANKVKDLLRGIVEDPKFNPGSLPQVSKWLFDKMRVVSPRKTKLTGNDSSDDRALSTLKLMYDKAVSAHDVAIKWFVGGELEYRELSKLSGTYVGPEALPSLVRDGRIHPTLKNTRTASGRLSSENPNLQNIPHRSELGKLIRGCFIAPDGHALLSVDLSQIELRIAAHLSKDKRMIASFLGGDDMHRITEREIFGVPDSKAGALRTSAKTFNFRVLYAGPDGSPRGLQEQLFLDGIILSVDECRDYRDGWFHLYSGVKQYIAECAREAKRTGGVCTPGGRWRPLPMAWVDGVRRAQAEAFRQGGNHPIQGGAQEVVKWAMVRWDRKYRGLVNTHIPCKLLMQIHDELLFEIAVPKHDPDRVRWAADMLIRMMTEDSPKYRVPILAEAKIGRSWAEQKKLDLKGPWHG